MMLNKHVIKNNFLSLAYFERESDLKRKWAKNYKPITPLQRTWTRYMLDLWADQYGGGVDRELHYAQINILGRLIISTEWSNDAGKRILSVINGLYRQGFRGDQLFLAAKEIVMPSRSPEKIIDAAIESDDAAFVESVLSAEFADDNPIKMVAIKYFCYHKSQRDIAAELNNITEEAARRKIRWCLNLFEGTAYHMMKAQSQQDKVIFNENDNKVIENAPRKCIV